MVRILLVEDDDLVRGSLEYMLARVGHDVSPSSDATSALQLLSSASFDVLLTDINLPGRLDGMELAVWARTAYPDMKIILMSGRHDLEQSAQELCAGAVFLKKPFGMADLGCLLE